jgi:hypothetical protein
MRFFFKITANVLLVTRFLPKQLSTFGKIIIFGRQNIPLETAATPNSGCWRVA